MTSRKAPPPAERKRWLGDPRRVVVKVGSGVLSRGGNGLHRATMVELAAAVARLQGRGVEVILVSSGAILAGMEALGLSQRPRDLPLKQAAAAVGQSHLIRAYEEAFQPHGRRVAQILLTDRKSVVERVGGGPELRHQQICMRVLPRGRRRLFHLHEQMRPRLAISLGPCRD